MQALKPSSRILTVCRRDLAELGKSPAFIVILAAFALIAVGIPIGAGLLAVKIRVNAFGPGDPAAFVKGIIGGILLENSLYAVTLLPFSLVVWIFATALVMREKLSGNLETLLATPLTLTELMCGKTLALSAVSTAVGWLCALLSLCAAHIVVAVIFSGFIPLVSAPALVASVILNPLLFSGMCALIIVLALTRDADAAILPSFIIGMGAMIGIPAGVGTGVIVIGSRIFCFYQFCASAALWLAVYALMRASKKETVVLSARK